MAKFLNISTESVPRVAPNFSEQAINTQVGPAPVLPPGTSLEANAIQPTQVQNAAVWTPMATFDAGLQSALINWINTTKDGVVYPQNFNGRAKVMDFFFTGSETKSLMPDEIGHFKVTFSYPPNA